ncbi:ankyrin repeat domain-containing protein 66 [Xiphophorus couchianus]|uniref:ankyrin repeat domain-containing protein 66 n=1 Tax=Xiphophorus couchianus TaxID=32473 RepID=UPI0010171610|nr:ankyrin repeat domain-containing protein 66-like [Xiphophorus couchianus]
MTELHQIVAAGDYEKVKEMLKNPKCNPNNKDVDWSYKTPLHWAAANGDTEIVKMLLENGANPCLKTAHGWTPAHYAAESGHLSTLRILHTFHAPMDKEDCCGDKPIRLAEIYGKEDCVRFLQKAELECRDFREKIAEEDIANDSDEEWLQQSKDYEEDIAFRTRRKTKTRLKSKTSFWHTG